MGGAEHQSKSNTLINICHGVHSIVVVKIAGAPIFPITDDEMEQNSPVSERPIITVETSETSKKTIFENIGTIVDPISDNFIYFGDTTFPVKNIKVFDFWSTSRKSRIFNYQHTNAPSLGFQRFYEDIMPVMITNTDDLSQAKSLDAYILSQALTNQMVYSPSINKTIIFTNNEYTDNHQTEALFGTPSLLLDSSHFSRAATAGEGIGERKSYDFY